MTRYTVTLHFTTAHSVGRGAGTPNHKVSQLVIPGRTLRGAFAARWWRQADGEERELAPRFAALFDQNFQVSFATPDGACLISTAELVCKYRPEDSCREQRINLAAAAVAGTKVDEACPVCGGPLTNRAGWHAPSSATRRTRSALETQANGASTAAVGQLFSREYRPPTTYSCTVTTTDDLSWLAGASLWVGGEVSNDTGRAQLSVAEAPTTPEEPNSASQELILTSPAILCDAYGSSTLEPKALADELRRVSECPLKVADHPSWLRSEQVTGWHGRSNLPYPTEWALAAGSTVIVTGLTAEGWGKLQAGIGWRTIDGFGQLKLGAAAPKAVNVIDEWKRLTRELRQEQQAWSNVKPALQTKAREVADARTTVQAAVAYVVAQGQGALKRNPRRQALFEPSHRCAIEAILSLPPAALRELHDKLKRKELK